MLRRSARLLSSRVDTPSKHRTLTNPNSAGIPADLVARIGLPGFYLEGQVGLWFIFARGTAVRFHATGGAGISLGVVRIGAEAGYLTSGGLIGGRVSFAF